MKPIEKHHIFSNLAKYTRSGMGIKTACESLLEQTRKQDERLIYENIKTGVTNGQTIANSISSAKGSINQLDYEMLDAAEQGGRLEMGFEHLGQYYGRVDKTRRKIRRGLIYPIALLHFALIVTTLVAAVFQTINFSGESVSFGKALWQSGRWVLLFYWLLAGITLVIAWVIKNSSKSAAADRFATRIPLLGKARRFAAMERFCSVFQFFLLSGQKMDIALDRSASAAGSAQIQADCHQGIKDIQAGKKLSPTFLQNPQSFTNDFARGITAAEESGMLDTEFERWRSFYSDSFAEAMDQVAIWFPKLIYFLALAVGALMVIRVGLSYVNLLNGVIDGF